ncbi:hypothetical protein IL54_4728 [Sphingobium sp. ba1]|uniref:DGQHR domain-containing protein n=1 Tax=Sphingobium sp. ba1 TaxID=1522072 RepID=UPI00055A777B|nr:DGQHR domain-containing protein [Sphingobium sp. ba1]OMG61367.1 hypothetical protein IL54_4728 [Sphingobium sp. ba1]
MGELRLRCVRGKSADRPVLLGFAAASTLHAISFADVLDEDSGRGYQRRYNAQHSLDFRRYIQQEGSATIPLTFNLRRRHSGRDEGWRIELQPGGGADIVIDDSAGRVLAQVDCQHRLGHLSDLDIELPFMCFEGLSEAEEMEVFSVINGKAKGLSRSLLDFHDAQLCTDLGADRPELFIALFLKNEPSSPWYKQLDLGGEPTSGLTRRASLRTMQKAVKRFLAGTTIAQTTGVESAAQTVLSFWSAIAEVLAEAWSQPRRHLLTKGIGVYALMDLASDLCNEARPGQMRDRRYFAALLGDFASDFDWSSTGPLQGLGGEGGVKAAIQIIRDARRRARLRVVSNG